MNNNSFVIPNATLVEQANDYQLKVELPGVEKEKVELNIDGKTLTLKAHSDRTPPEGFRTVAEEFTYDNYAVSVDLPELADPDQLTASMNNGILLVNIGKRQTKQARRIEIG